jgi:hypothetical protein
MGQATFRLITVATITLLLGACANVEKDEMVAKAETACFEETNEKAKSACMDRFLADRNVIASRNQYERDQQRRAREDRYGQGEALRIPKRDRNSLPIPPSSSGPGVPPAPRSPR